MKTTLNDLAACLQRSDLRMICLNSKEPVLLDEARQYCQQYLCEQGFQRAAPQFIDGSFDWAALAHSTGQGSLFSDKTFYELLAQTGKFSKTQGEALLKTVEALSADEYLVLTCPQLDKAMQKTKWFQKLEKHALWITLWPHEGQQALVWLKQHAKTYELSLSTQQLQQILHFTTGNLNSAKQCLQRLSLHNQPQIDDHLLEQELKDEARFEIFDLSKAFLQNDLIALRRLLQRLRETGSELVLVLWVLIRDLRVLAQLAAMPANPQQRNQLFMRYQVWDKHQANYLKALSQQTARDWQHLLQSCLHIDKQIKGASLGDPWHQLDRLVCRQAALDP